MLLLREMAGPAADHDITRTKLLKEEQRKAAEAAQRRREVARLEDLRLEQEERRREAAANKARQEEEKKPLELTQANQAREKSASKSSDEEQIKEVSRSRGCKFMETPDILSMGAPTGAPCVLPSVHWARRQRVPSSLVHPWHVRGEATQRRRSDATNTETPPSVTNNKHELALVALSGMPAVTMAPYTLDTIASVISRGWSKRQRPPTSLVKTTAPSDHMSADGTHLPSVSPQKEPRSTMTTPASHVSRVLQPIPKPNTKRSSEQARG